MFGIHPLKHLERFRTSDPDFRATAIRFGTFVHDLLFATLSVYLAIFVAAPDVTTHVLTRVSSGSIFIGAVLFGSIATGIGAAFGLNRGIWRYASIHELRMILVSAILAIGVWGLVLMLIGRIGDVPRSIIVLTVTFYCLLIGGSRFAFRTFRNELRAHRRRQAGQSGAIFLGSPELADVFLRWAGDQPKLGYKVIGIVDPRGRRSGRSIRSIPVLGGVADLPVLLQDAQNSQRPLGFLIVALRQSELDQVPLAQIIDVTAQHSLRVLRVPDMSDVDGATKAPQPFDVLELLPRQSVTLDFSALAPSVAGKTIVITGAGGSIGSELCRQVLTLKPKRLVLLENSETQLFNIWQPLTSSAHTTEIVTQLCDVRDRRQTIDAMLRFEPTIVFHAAALKHVPFVEAQPLEGLHTNAIGSRNVADAAVAAKARAMVLISTDKAVRATSAMGATKRFAELYCQYLDITTATQFVVVRFGNVLGSAGSVVPLFQAQLEKGGPLTVTHVLVERFFMTMPEASRLVLNAASFAMRFDTPRGLIYGLDMGKPVRIMELARRIIQLAGLRPDVDIAIKLIGLRVGEKLYEEVFAPDESPTQANVPGIIVGKPMPIDRAAVEAAISGLEQAIANLDEAAGVAVMRAFVTDYVPDTAWTAQGNAATAPDKADLPAPSSAQVIPLFQRI
jgi:FlaA1/EpsC-like NDP-sugar epimerase